ncbi:MAG: polysaccharide biosynthesis/export family protein [Acidobacteria bacterium]|nr:polysaccharide biosynthesis/export family protein [Acidobacteriota bacterium]
MMVKVRSTTFQRAKALIVGVSFVAGVNAGAAQAVKPADPAPNMSPTAATVVSAPADYVIGPSDLLSIVFWKEKDLTCDVVVRPDGRISVPLLNDVQAAGLTPEQLRQTIVQSAKRFIEQPVVAVVVKQISNNRVFIAGQVLKPGPFPLAGPTTVLQVISMAGGVTEFADRKNIIITRQERGGQRTFRFNYAEVIKGKNLEQNIVLKAGDTIMVP